MRRETLGRLLLQTTRRLTVADDGTISQNRKPLKFYHGKEDQGSSGKNDYAPVKENEEKKKGEKAFGESPLSSIPYSIPYMMFPTVSWGNRKREERKD